MHIKTVFFFFLLILAYTGICAQSTDSTYAEKLGYPKGSKLLILHVDDAGMSYDSNQGTIEAITKGAANSCSVMMPCSWVPAFVHFLKKHPEVDAGLHLTLTSEWSEYRWGSVTGKAITPGLTDEEGNLWPSVQQVATHASAAEVEKEIIAQIDKARKMGFEPTHLDSHMGTLFARPDFLMAYIKVGIENHIPVMIPAGHVALIKKQMHAPDQQIAAMRNLGKTLWDSGLPVLDDLHNVSYDWPIPAGIANSDKKLQAFKTAKYIEGLQSLKPGVTMMIMHCTQPSSTFKEISTSGAVRKGDLLAMLDPAFKAALKKEGIVTVTWRELMEKRQKISQLVKP